jgi:PhnB protein
MGATEPTTISAMLIVPDADAAIAWYQTALGATQLWNLGGVAGLHIDGAPFFLHEDNPDNPTESSPQTTDTTNVRIELFVDDPDAVIDRALAAGATARSTTQDHDFLGTVHRQGGFCDPFGHNWSVGDKAPLQPRT